MAKLRKILTLALTGSFCVIGMPICVMASEDGAVSPEQVLTLNGRPWSHLSAAKIAAGVRLRLVSVEALPQTAGQIRGVALSATGQPLADQLVELSRPSRDGPGRLIATTDANGEFVYTGLRPGGYEVHLRLRVDNQVVARSGAIDLVEGQMQVTGVTLIEHERRSKSRGAAMAIGVGLGALLGLVLGMAGA